MALRADVFIDASNFSIACRDLMGGRYVGIKALARLVARRSCHELGEVFYYDSPSPTPDVQRRKQQFWENLKASRIHLQLGRIEPNYRGGHREKECDVMIAVDMIARACDKVYDRAILISGDTDLTYALDQVMQRGRQVGWAYLPTQHHIDRLRQVVPAAHQILLDEKTLRPILA